MSRVLIIAYGNPLRCDDSVAWQAAEEIRRKVASAQAEIICVHQLTPELAEQVSRADSVIFLDASRNGEPGKVTCEPVSSRAADLHFWHNLTPGSLLALGAQLYGPAPRAFCVSLCGESFDHGETLSPAVIQGLPRLVARVDELVSQLANAGVLSSVPAV